MNTSSVLAKSLGWICLSCLCVSVVDDDNDDDDDDKASTDNHWAPGPTLTALHIVFLCNPHSVPSTQVLFSPSFNRGGNEWLEGEVM